MGGTPRRKTRAAKAALKKQGRHSKEGEGGLFRLWDPFLGPRQRHRDNKEITTPGILGAAGDMLQPGAP